MTRGWCYTINNFTEEDRDGLRSLECVYNIFGYDEAPKALRIYRDMCILRVTRRLREEEDDAKGTSWALKGTIDQAGLLQKEGDFEEFGVKPLSQSEKGKKNKERWDEALKAAKEGRFEDIPSDIRLRYHSSIKK